MDNLKITIEYDKDNNKLESLWVKKVGRYYEIINIPFFAYGLSFGDIVEVEEVNGVLMYKNTVRRSGHSTYRVFCKDTTYQKFDFFWKILESLGCSYERATKDLYSIDVPPFSNADKVYEILELGEKRGAWEFEEGHCGHLPT